MNKIYLCVSIVCMSCYRSDLFSFLRLCATATSMLVSLARAWGFVSWVSIKLMDFDMAKLGSFGHMCGNPFHFFLHFVLCFWGATKVFFCSGAQQHFIDHYKFQLWRNLSYYAHVVCRKHIQCPHTVLLIIVKVSSMIYRLNGWQFIESRREWEWRPLFELNV